MNWPVPLWCRADQSWVTKTMKLVMIPLTALALAGAVAGCQDDNNGSGDEPTMAPTTVVTSYVPDPDEPPVLVSPSTSVSVSPSPSVSVSVSTVPDEIPGGNGDEDPQDGRPAH